MSALSKIEHFKDLHKGKRLFILASGPSLSTCDLSKLKRRLVMGLNRSFFAYPETHYHCCMDQRLFDLHADLLKKTRYLFTLEGRPWGIKMPLLGSEGFSENLSQGIFSGYTISYLAIQLAIYMGFSELVFLGLDLAHKSGNTHFFGNDFHSRNHESTEFPRMKKMLEHAAERSAALGVKLFSCSEANLIKGWTAVEFEKAAEW